MKILLFGRNGQIGWELNRSLLPLGEIAALGREDADLSNPESLREIVQTIKPDVIINAAAYTAVDKAEEEEELASVVNGVAPGILAQEAKKINALLVHYSTDYVFDGTKGRPYVETDQPNPINAYGRTKLAGEQAIQSSGCEYLIIRTAWVYSARGSNFLLSVLRLAGDRQELNIVNDQTGTPTWARNIADITENIVLAVKSQHSNGEFTSGVYNIASSGETTWFNFAKDIVDMVSTLNLDIDLAVNKINPISSDDYQTAAVRPGYSVLSTEKIETTFGFSPIQWKDSLQCCMGSIRQSEKDGEVLF